MARRVDIAARLPLVIAYREADMAAALGISAAKLGQLVHAGLLPKPRLLDGIKLYDVEEARARFRELPVEGEDRVNPWDETLS